MGTVESKMYVCFKKQIHAILDPKEWIHLQYIMCLYTKTIPEWNIKFGQVIFEKILHKAFLTQFYLQAEIVASPARYFLLLKPLIYYKIWFSPYT